MLVARFTENPQGDIERGWSGWMGMAWKTLNDVACDKLVNGDANLDYDDIANKSNTELKDMLSANGFDIRFDDFAQLWREVHHDGLSCFKLVSQSIEEAKSEVQARHLEWIGDGYMTIGNVSLVTKVDEIANLCIFEVEDVAKEN